jgi:hypothetical protein
LQTSGNCWWICVFKFQWIDLRLRYLLLSYTPSCVSHA